MGYFQYRSEQLMGQLLSELNYSSTDTIISSGLHEYLDGLQHKMNEIDDSMRAEFIARSERGQTQSQSQSQR